MRHVARREAILAALITASAVLTAHPDGSASALVGSAGDGGSQGGQRLPFGVSDDVAASLRYVRVLGKGSYKTVYLVRSNLIGEDASGGGVEFAMAVERLTSGSRAQDAVRGIEVADLLQERAGEGERRLFERVEGWWLQPGGVEEFEPGARVFAEGSVQGRTRKIPNRFLGAKTLVALKPVYSMDLKRFAQRAPDLLPVGSAPAGGAGGAVGGVGLDEASAVRLALDLCAAGRVLHQEGLVHRDIKPKNVMLSGGSAVVIDFGFTEVGGGRGRVCVWGANGELRYVLGEDVARMRGCREGDAYAMGKTLYEVVFAPPEPGGGSGADVITAKAARKLNASFRARLESGGGESRFGLSREGAEGLMGVIRGLCREADPLTFREAEASLVALQHSLQLP